MRRMDLFEAMSTCRAIRRLKPDPIPDALLRKVLTAATWAASGGNRQPWRFVVVRDRERKRQLRDLYVGPWRAYAEASRGQLARLPEAARLRTERTLRAADHMADHLDEAPVIVVVCVKMTELMITDLGLDRPPLVGGGSVYTAVQNLLLACRAEGLGGVLTTLLCMKEPEIKSLLGIPDGWATCAHVPIGYPAGKGHGPLERRPIESFVFLDRWDEPLWQSA